MILAVTRIAGILIGVITSQLLSVLVMPRTATVEAIGEINKSMRGLAELNRLTWQASAFGAKVLKSLEAGHEGGQQAPG